MSTSDNPELICRSCTRVLSRHKHHLLETPLLADLYKRLSATILESNDPLPKSICSACNQRLKDFENFQTKCMESYKNLLLRFPSIVGIKSEEADETIKEEQAEIPFTEAIVAFPTNFDDDFKNEDDPLSADDGENVSETKIENRTCSESKKDPMGSDDEPLMNCLKVKRQAKLQSSQVEPKAIVKKRCVTRPKNKRAKKTKKTTLKSQQNQKQNVRFACNQCPKTFSQEYLYEGHLRKHQGLKPFGCKLCDRAFLKSTRLKEHMLVWHTENPTLLPCTVEGCQRSYKCKSDLHKHIKSHSKPKGEKLRHLVCELCGKAYYQSTSLQRHKLVHSGLYPFECDICPRKYREHKELKNHKLKHAGIKNYACPICGLRKTTNRELKAHINVHTREKTYPCEFCDKSFLTITRTNQHKNTVHLGVRNFPCTHCDQRFAKAETLKHHEMTHTGEKPHECPICHKRFIQKPAFQYHVKRHGQTSTEATT